MLATASGVLSPATVEALVHLLGPEAVLFAVVYPCEKTGAAVATLERTALPPEVKHRIGSANARALLRL
ncbi:hypothetical protein AB0G73_33645 [Streptomyces sp. NPDC020719]|uniref:hypothetical protein n=1 Tax=Streptomyces sp. NPDC020719 TaxID=3154896 RepID=UPI0033C75481